MPKLDVASIPKRTGSGYPAPFHEVAKDRARQRLGDAGGLTQFGVNLLTLPPGAWSSQRHWHSGEDEFVYVLSGDCAAFPKNVPDGHHLINKSHANATVLEVGTRSEEDFCDYPDIDLKIDSRDGKYTHKDGTPYPERQR
jgi:uncharacterized cupin superfamily protein